MKNEAKRSATAVLLAAAMLLSTQGITAFADTEKIELPATEITQTTEKPETPEKPAEGEGEEQEKPETETPETPADPSAVAPAAPVAPEMGIEPASVEGNNDSEFIDDIVRNSPRVYKWSAASFNGGLGETRVIVWTQSTTDGQDLGNVSYTGILG